MNQQSRELLFACAVMVILMALAMVPVFAAPVFKTPDESVIVRLSEDACADEKVVGHLRTAVRQEYRDQFRAATVRWTDNKTYQACWIGMGGHVYVLCDDGQPLQAIPYRLFVEEGV